MTLDEFLSIVDGGVYCDIYDSSSNKAIITNEIVYFIHDTLFQESVWNRIVVSCTVTSLGNLEIWIK